MSDKDKAVAKGPATGAHHLPPRKVNERMSTFAPPRPWVREICRKSVYDPSVRSEPAGVLLREGEEISQLFKDGSKAVGKYICGGDSCFYAKRFHGAYKRWLQLVPSRGSGPYESKYLSEDDPALSILPTAKRFTPKYRVSTRSMVREEAKRIQREEAKRIPSTKRQRMLERKSNSKFE